MSGYWPGRMGKTGLLTDEDFVCGCRKQPGVSTPFRLVEETALAKFTGFVCVEVKTAWHWRGGLPLDPEDDNQSDGSGTDDRGPDNQGEVHGLLRCLAKDRFNQEVGFSFAVNGVNGFVWKVVKAFFPLLPAKGSRGPWALGFIFAPGHAELGPRFLFFQLLEHAPELSFLNGRLKCKESDLRDIIDHDTIALMTV